MKLQISLLAACCGLIVVGCEQKDQDAALAQGQAVVSKAQTMAGSAWKSVSDEASKLSPDSGKQALESATKQMEGLKDKMSQIKAPTGLDSLKLESVKAEIERLRAALDLQKLKAELDERVVTAKKLKENTEKKHRRCKSQTGSCRCRV